jgi:hypothetical protein
MDQARRDTNSYQQVTGSSLYEPWFPPWILDLATEHNGIVISPNYRFLPESTGLDIMSDIESAWEWIQAPTGLATLLQTSASPDLEADLERILTTGDSAGKSSRPDTESFLFVSE